MRIRTMRVNHLKTPLGFACSYPVFSWITEECRGKRQTQARMRIALDQKMEKVVYDSEWQQEIKSTAFCPNVQLSPRTRYYWQVQIRTEKGEQGSSPITWFETGKMEELWQGHWIKAVFSDENSNGCSLFQKIFQVPEDLASARVYLTGMGMLEVVVNGQRVSEEYLAPYDTESGHWIQYVTYDLTELLKKGKENVLGVSMGNGWDTAGIGFKAESKSSRSMSLSCLQRFVWRQISEKSWWFQQMIPGNVHPPLFWRAGCMKPRFMMPDVPGRILQFPVLCFLLRQSMQKSRI